jgi:hypothetical protein
MREQSIMTDWHHRCNAASKQASQSTIEIEKKVGKNKKEKVVDPVDQ